jgi:diadenylate cyclase
VDGFLYALQMIISQFSFKDVIDIILVSVVIYWLLKITSQTRATQVLRGVIVILILYFICSIPGYKLQTMQTILYYILSSGAIVIVILFQPELRAALERLGRGKLFVSGEAITEDTQSSIQNIHRALLELSKSRTGAIIVFEQNTGLKDVLESGTLIGSIITKELIENIFFVGSPLHDGAVIIQGLRILAAGCFLPLSTNTHIDKDLGTRHRAALGISEISDSVTFVVSEETGIISMSRNGALTRYLNSKQLLDILQDMYSEKSSSKIFGVKRKVKE